MGRASPSSARHDEFVPRKARSEARKAAVLDERVRLDGGEWRFGSYARATQPLEKLLAVTHRIWSAPRHASLFLLFARAGARLIEWFGLAANAPRPTPTLDQAAYA
eukprot:3114210-Alexandrium_andersonii.AAC.2